MYKKSKFHSAFTIVELIIVVSVIAVLAGIAVFTAATIQKSTRDSARDAQVSIIASSLEKYYRDNGEYPSVAAMTSSDIATLKQKLGISNASVFKLPLAGPSVINSIATSSPSATTVVYSGNTTDTTKNTQCQTDANGYCDGFTLAYVKEAGGATQTKQSIHATFQTVKTECDAGDTQSGDSCTHTYTGAYQAGAYTCPSGGSLSGTTCTRTYAASYSPASSGYYCPSGGSISGTTCTTSSSYQASCLIGDPNHVEGYAYGTWEGSQCVRYFSATNHPAYYTCPNGGSLNGSNQCEKAANSNTTYTCPHSGSDSLNGQNNCRHERPSYNTKAGCENAGWTWGGSNCFNVHSADSSTIYSCSGSWTLYGNICWIYGTYNAQYYTCSYGTVSGSQCRVVSTDYVCPSGGTLSGTTCATSSSYTATYYSSGGYYYCSGSDSLSGSNCTNTYTGTQGAGYYTCPSGGIASGSTCSYTYQLKS